MARNRDITGRPFGSTTVGAVWRKGKPIPDFSPELWRRDVCGRAMKFGDYGNMASEYGWEVDHIRPAAKGGTDDLSNLQPLYWDNNRRKGDAYPWSCVA